MKGFPAEGIRVAAWRLCIRAGRQATALLALLTIAATGDASLVHTFDANAEGWEQSTVGYGSGWYEQLLPNTSADWTGSYGAGQPKGSIHQDATTAWEGRAYWMGIRGVTAALSLGDLTGKILSAHLRSTANWVGRVSTDTVYLRWTIGTETNVNGGETVNLWASKAVFSVDLNDAVFGSGTDDDWVYVTIEMDEDRFFKWPTSNGDPTQTFGDALSEYTTFGLAILPTPAGTDDPQYNFGGGGGTWGSGYTLLHYGAAASDGSATWGVDNFTAVPEPFSGVLFAMGLAVAGLRSAARQRRS